MKQIYFFSICLFLSVKIFADTPTLIKTPSESFQKIGEFEFRKIAYDYTLGDDTIKHLNTQALIIVFEAAWCSQCRKSLPIYHELAQKYKNKMMFYRINYDEDRALADSLGVRQLPTVMFFPVSGKPKFMVGYVPKDEFESIIEQTKMVQ